MRRMAERTIHTRPFLFFCCILLLGTGLGGCNLSALVTSSPASGATPASVSSRTPTVTVTTRLLNRFEKKSGSHGPLQFGSAIDLDGDTLVVGASQRLALAGYQNGMVFVYQREGDQWVENSQLTASNQDEATQSDIHFGSALALQGDTLMVGAPEADDPVNGENSGAVFIFQRRANQWEPVGVLTASDRTANAHFGKQIALQDDVLLVSGGNQGQTVYVFEHREQAWLETARLTGEAMGEKDAFGTSLAIGGNHLAVGAINYDPQQHRYVSSRVYLFRRQGQNWVQETQLTPDDQDNIVFGRALALDENTLVVGSGGDEVGYLAGTVYIFEYEPGGWKQRSKLVAADGSPYSGFGTSVDLQGDFLAIGSGFDSSHSYMAGSVYLFRRVGDTWIDVLKLYPNEGDFEGAFFGASLKVSGDTLLVAAPDEFGYAVYIFEVSQAKR